MKQLAATFIALSAGLVVSEVPLEPFQYPRSAPLELEQHGVEERQGVFVRDISYNGAEGIRISAYLLQPTRNLTSAPAVLFMHATGEDRSQFLAEGVGLAGAGSYCLLVQLAMNGPIPFDLEASPEEALRLLVERVVHLRRSIDLLWSLPEVDRGNIGFVGHGWGVTLGGILSGVDRRFRAAVLSGGRSHLAAALETSIADKKRKSWRRLLAPFDPVSYLELARETAFLFQFGENDGSLSRQQADGWQKGTSTGEVRWYEASHRELVTLAEPAEDRMNWLAARLGFF